VSMSAINARRRSIMIVSREIRGAALVHVRLVKVPER